MDFLKGINPREYQKEIFEKCIEKNCLVVLPTGLGKTLIALMLTIERMKKYPKEKVVFVAPTRPLIEQHLTFFKKHLPELFAELTLFTGEVKAEERKKLWQNADIIFSTPQCIANDLRNKLYDLKEVCLLIEDEAHRCIKNYDYTYISKHYSDNALHQRIIGLTASPGSDPSKVREICKNLCIEEIEVKTRESEDVKKYLQELKVERKFVEFPEEFEELRIPLKKIFEKYVEELKSRKVLFGNYSKTSLIELQGKLIKSISSGKKDFNSLLAVSVCAQAIKIQHAIELLETQTLKSFNDYLEDLSSQATQHKSKGVIKLVNKPEFKQVYIKSKELLSKGVEHPKIQVVRDLILQERINNQNLKAIIFTQFRDSAKIISQNLNKIPEFKSRVFIGQAKKETKSGKTGLSQKEQKDIIHEFSQGKINALCATSIGEEGLDIPEVNLVIFYEPVPSAIRKIQRSGRTARLSAGKLIILITKNTRDETFYYVANSKEKKMHKTISDIKDEIKNKTINIKGIKEKQQTL